MPYIAIAALPLVLLISLPIFAGLRLSDPDSGIEIQIPDGSYDLVVESDSPADPNEPTDPPVDPDPPTEPPIEPPVEPPVENTQPVGVDDIFGLDWQGRSVLKNDYDPDGDPITALVRRGSVPAVGDFALDRDTGLITFTDAPPGTYRIAYNVSDGQSKSWITEIWICVDVCTDPLPDPTEPPPPVDPDPDPMPDSDIPVVEIKPIGPRFPGTDPIMDPSDPDFDPKMVEWPEMAVTYSPQLPPIGNYSIPEACPSLHEDSAPTVTLGDHEPLNDAIDRLAEKTDFVTGGIVKIPYDVDTLQCDAASVGTRSGMNRVTISGVLGPNGEMPKFYCRFANFDHLGRRQRGFPEGTIPHKGNKWLGGGGGDDEYFQLLVENVEVDGYRGFFGTGSVTGKYIFRHVWAHHGRGDGFFHDGTAHIYLKDRKNGTDLWRQQTHNLEFHVCGSQISHTGQDNGQHGMYLHGTFGGVDPDNPWLAELTGNGVDSWHKSYIVDNVFHDTNYSSAYKSLDDEQFIVGNTFYHVLDTDPTFSVMPSSMLVDIPACTLATIKENTFYLLDGRFGIAFRNRRPPHRGCDMPAMWYPGLKKDENNNAIQPDPIPGPWHTNEWWQSLNKKQFFTLRVENNRFYQDPKSTKQKAKPITNMGTYPNFQSGFGGDSCYLPTPMTWYERSNVIADKNEYFGVSRSNNYVVSTPGHSYKGRCPTDDPPPGPMPPTNVSEYFTIGDGEVYK